MPKNTAEPVEIMDRMREVDGGILRTLCVFVVVALSVASICNAADDNDLSQHRIVYHFDFDERDDGNLEGLPMYWDPYRPDKFPRFASGSLDSEVGRLDESSFYLASNGRSVAYHYTGPDTLVQPNTNYLVEGYIRPDQLVNARAWLSVHFLDDDRNPIPGTLVRSEAVASAEGGDEWVRVQMYLPSAPQQARSIGLIVWVVQESVWNTSLRMRRHITRNDIRAGAWFDDISIRALPKLSLTTSSPGNVLAPGPGQELRVLLAAYSDSNLVGKLRISSSMGEEIAVHEVPVSIGKQHKPVVIDVSDLEPGAYRAQVEVFAGDAAIVSRSLSFVRLGELHEDDTSGAASFGIVVDPKRRVDPQAELNLLKMQGVRAVKIPVWAGKGTAIDASEKQRASDLLLQNLVQDGFALTGVFCGPPRELAESAGAYQRPLLELLSEDPGVWRDHLAAVVAPNASVFRWWQLGSDGDPNFIGDQRLGTSLGQLRTEMLPFISMPLLAVPESTDVYSTGRVEHARQSTVSLGSDVHPEWFEQLIGKLRGFRYDVVSAYIQPLSERSYSLLPRLSDWARRVILARHGNADVVYVPQTWQVRKTPNGSVAEPMEEYLILRTIAGILADAEPAGRLRFAGGAEALIFYQGDSAVLAMWDVEAPPEGIDYHVQLGRAVRQVDYWGRSTPLKKDESGRHIVRLSPAPIFVDNIERWLIEFRTSVALTPTNVSFGARSIPYKLHMANNSAVALSGRLKLDVHETWDVAPNNFNISLSAGRSREVDLDFRFPFTEPAGHKDVVAQITLGQGPYYLEVPLSFQLGLENIDVWGMVIVRGNDLLLRQIVTNRTDEVLHFRGSSSVPDRPRQYQPLTGIEPGDTAVAEYWFTDAAVYSGRSVRLDLRELNDGSRMHNLVLVVP